MSTSKDEPVSDRDGDVESTAERRHGFLGLGRKDTGSHDDGAAGSSATESTAGATAVGSSDDTTRHDVADPDDTTGDDRDATARHDPDEADRTDTGALRTQETIGGDTRAMPVAAAGDDDRVPPRRDLPPRETAALSDARERGAREQETRDDHARESHAGPGEDRNGGVLAGATQARPRSRGGAHVLSLIVCLLLVPVAWYLVADGGARLTLGDDAAWESGRVNVAAVLELLAGLVVAAVVLLSARWSSLGVTVTGIIVLLAGLAFVVVPALVRDVLEPVLEGLRDFNDLGANVATHLVADGTAGRLALYGLALLLLGVVSHGARRLGRDEERARTAYARGTGTEA